MEERVEYSSYRWVVLGVYMIVVALTQFLWLNFAPIEDIIRQQLNISEFKVSWLTSIFPLLSIILSAPVGSLLDAKGFKFTVGLGVIIMGISVLLRLNYNSYMWLFLGQFGISVAQPFIMNSVSKLAATWFDKSEEAIANGLSSMAMFVGMIIAMVLTPILAKEKGIGEMLFIYGIITLIGCILFLLLAKDNPSLASILKEEEEEYNTWTAYKEIFKMKDMLLLIGIMFIGLGFFNGFMTWIDELLKPEGFSSVQTGIIGGVIIMGGIVGAVVIPLLSDLVKRRKPFLITATMVGGITMFPFLNTHKLYLALAIGAVIGFFVIALLPIIFQMTIEIVGERLTGTATGLLMLMGSIGAVAVIYLMEYIKVLTNSFHSSMWLFVAFFIVAFIMAINIRETHPAVQLSRNK
ncbi:MAG: MFS transporter [bacterium]